MHEIGIARDLFCVIAETAKANNVTSVKEVRIKLGVASGIEEDFLVHSFIDHVFPGSIADGATLEIIKESVKAKCKGCGNEIDIEDDPVMECPVCGNRTIKITQGKDVYVEEIRGT